MLPGAEKTYKGACLDAPPLQVNQKIKQIWLFRNAKIYLDMGQYGTRLIHCKSKYSILSNTPITISQD